MPEKCTKCGQDATRQQVTDTDTIPICQPCYERSDEYLQYLLGVLALLED